VPPGASLDETIEVPSPETARAPRQEVKA